MVFLHEGLGSVAAWRDFPDRVAAELGCRALVYSRRGYGSSEPVAGPRPVRFMHEEALEVLPAVLAHFGLGRVALFGHSDGASIALIYSGSHPEGVAGLVLLAPHVFVEPVCLESIARLAAAYESTDLARRLGRYHEHTDAMFRAWADVWLRPEFALWNIEEVLPAVTAPVLVVQGEDDEYGTLRQVEAITRQVGGRAEALLLPGAGHSSHRDRPAEVLAATTRFLGRVFGWPIRKKLG
ncbi:MAG TPA: alpha/beta hydrolase [Thermoanaerobaculia bacterium]|nr:alpha/beta hydrolase [Thermoanaerobaculia bacterium]